jgi:hypothetical protein
VFLVGVTALARRFEPRGSQQSAPAEEVDRSSGKLEAMTNTPTLKPSIYLRKREADHPFWEFARFRGDGPPPGLPESCPAHRSWR